MRKIPILLSYFYIRQRPESWNAIIAATAPYVDWMIDSGAFSDYGFLYRAARRGTSGHVPITVTEYCAWLQGMKQYLWGYVALDKILDDAESDRNLDVMWAEGLRPMPVLTVTHPVERMTEWVDRADWLCVAGAATAKPPWVWNRLDAVRKVVGDDPRLHALGFAVWPDVRNAPIESADTSSWMSGGRYGFVAGFDPVLGLRQGRSKDRHRPYVALTMTAESSHTKGPQWKGTAGLGHLMCTTAYLQMQQEVARNNGRRLFLAVAGPSLLATILTCADSLRHESRFNFIDSVVRYRALAKRIKQRDTAAVAAAFAEAAGHATGTLVRGGNADD